MGDLFGHPFRVFLKDYLELLDYLIYTILFYLTYKKSRLARHKLLCYYYLLEVAILLEATIFYNMDNIWNYNLLFFFMIVAFSWYFKSIFINPVKKNTVLVLLALNVMAFVYFEILRQSFFAYNDYIYAGVFITIVIFTLMYFHQLLLNVREENILLDFDFWFISGSLLYFLGSFFIVFFYDDTELFSRAKLWMVQNTILFISCLAALCGYLYIANSKTEANVIR